MSKHPMEADRDAVADHEEQCHREQDVAEVDAPTPEPDEAEHDRSEGSTHDDGRDRSLRGRDRRLRIGRGRRDGSRTLQKVD